MEPQEKNLLKLELKGLIMSCEKNAEKQKSNAQKAKDAVSNYKKLAKMSLSDKKQVQLILSDVSADKELTESQKSELARIRVFLAQ